MNKPTDKSPQQDKPAKPDRAETNIDIAEHIKKALSVALPTAENPGRIYDILKFYFDPKLIGSERISAKPSLYVGNHGTMGFEGGFIPKVVLKETGTLPRLLSDELLMSSPLADNFLKMGQVLANQEVCKALMQAGQSVMVFPGGAKEGATKRNERNKLVWGSRTGFVRMAIECGFTITPFAHVGPDDMWDFWMDGNELANTAFGRLLKRILADKFDESIIPPIPKGLAGSPIPRPERLYIAFGEPIDLSKEVDLNEIKLSNDRNTQKERDLLLKLQGQIGHKVDDLMEEALLARKADRNKMHWLRKRLTRH